MQRILPASMSASRRKPQPVSGDLLPVRTELASETEMRCTAMSAVEPTNQWVMLVEVDSQETRVYYRQCYEFSENEIIYMLQNRSVYWMDVAAEEEKDGPFRRLVEKFKHLGERDPPSGYYCMHRLILCTFIINYADL